MFQLPFIDPGTFLFRFMDHEAAHFWSAIQDMLVNQKLYLNSRTRFNDLYDSQPEIDDDLAISDLRSYSEDMIRNPWHPQRDVLHVSKLLELIARGKFRLKKTQLRQIKNDVREGTNEFLDQCGLTSFSLVADNPLLWGHYAAGSSGVCVVFRRGTSMHSALCVCAKVSYVDKRPSLPTSLFYELVRAKRAFLPFDEVANRIIFLSFLHKSKQWEYEHEARVFYPFSASKKIRFDRTELISVVVGPRASPELEFKLKQIASEFAPQVAVQRALLSQNGYGIVFPRDLGNAA